MTERLTERLTGQLTGQAATGTASTEPADQGPVIIDWRMHRFPAGEDERSVCAGCGRRMCVHALANAVIAAHQRRRPDRPGQAPTL
jgi:hypothetical protein